MRAVIAPMSVRKAGSIVNISSIDGLVASDESSYCTGAQFVIDGGHLAGPFREGFDDFD